MLSYRHAFHAGNFADILKHLVLVNTLHYVIRKDAPVFYMDTHGGAGLYELVGKQASKTGEAEAGIIKLDFDALLKQAGDSGRQALSNYHKAIAPYLQRSKYPGSPLLAADILRAQDHLQVCELHPSDYQLLASNTRHDKRIRCEQQDGYQRALALLPPVQKRVVVLIDPSYEEDADMQGMSKMIADIHKRMAGAQILLWYPVVKRRECTQLIESLKRRKIRDLWQFELGIAEDSTGYGMTASGMLVVNPPWTLAEQMQQCLPLVQQQLSGTDGYYSVTQLTAE